MKKTFTPLATLALATTLTFAIPTSFAAAPAKAVLCMACHGAKGISSQEIYPNLAGQKKAYLIQSIKAYKNGTRNNAVMKGMTATLSDKDIKELADYYSKLK